MSLLVGAKAILHTSLEVKSEEHVLIVADSETEKIAEALFEAAHEFTDHVALVKIRPRTKAGEEPPRHVASMMLESDCIVLATSHSMTHTRARRAANRSGSRIVSLPGVTEDLMSEGGLTADFGEIAKLARRVHRRVKGAREGRITSRAGTDFTVELTGREWIADDTGLCNRPNQTATLPGGRLFIAPREPSGKGKLIVDGSMMRLVKEPIEITVQEGAASKILGGSWAVQEMNRGGREGRIAGELGIGLNANARITGNPLEDEKALGCVYVGFGDNYAIGGKVNCGVRIQAVLRKPTLEIDERIIVEEGKVLF